MYVIAVRAHYDAAHGLRDYQGAPEPLHGHRFVVEAAFATAELREGGMAFDFVPIQRQLELTITPFQHANLNETPPFTELEPSAECQARFIYDELRRQLPPDVSRALLYVRVWETPEAWAQYSERAPWG